MVDRRRIPSTIDVRPGDILFKNQGWLEKHYGTSWNRNEVPGVGYFVLNYAPHGCGTFRMQLLENEEVRWTDLLNSSDWKIMRDGQFIN